ncbi:PAP2 family protein [Oscillochloris sp. ZM17-4]|uniref:PAP2 family protein n=1 Tax=Oscillochloris sp. ZM17-4 TaxID=2866714 RepID=UPI001C73709A|nr:PAP2 family protein [Oscillochloris sp. ZM17-4]MBX0329073.1 PAP2 family protein [Oscillochloris sp. ZM17-4]
MTQQNDLTAEALRRGAVPGRGYAIARTISQIFHPVILSIISIFIVGLMGVAPTMHGLGWAALCTLIQVLPPTIFFSIRLRQGAYTDDDVSVRSQRNELYLFGMATVLAGVGLLSFLGAPTPLVALLASAALLNGTSWLINLFWKISIHSAGIGSCATIAALYSKPLGLLLWVCALSLGWARVRTRNHTPMQVAAGLALACACVVGSYMAFGLL